MGDEDVERAAVEEILQSADPPQHESGDSTSLSSASYAAAELAAATAAAKAVSVVDFSIPPPGVVMPTGPPMPQHPQAAAIAAGQVHWSLRGKGLELASTLRNPIRPRGMPDYPRGMGFPPRGRGGPDLVSTMRYPPYGARGRRKFIGLEDDTLSDEERKERWNRTRDGTRKEYDPDGDYIYDARKYFDADKYRQIVANRRKKLDIQRGMEDEAEQQHLSYLAYMSGHYPYVKPVITRPLPPVRNDSDSDEFDYDYYDEVTRAETFASEMAEQGGEVPDRYGEEFFSPYPEPGPYPDERRFGEPMYYNDYRYDEFYDRRGPPGGPMPPYMADGPPPQGYDDRFRGRPYEARVDRRESRSRSRTSDRQKSFSRSPGTKRESYERKGSEGREEEGRRFRDGSGDRKPERSPSSRTPRSPSGRPFPEGPRYGEGFPDMGRGGYGYERGRYFRGRGDFGGRGGYYRPYDRHYGGRGSRYDRYDMGEGGRRGEERRVGGDFYPRDVERVPRSGASPVRRRSKSYSSSSSSPSSKRRQRSEVAAVKRRSSESMGGAAGRGGGGGGGGGISWHERQRMEAHRENTDGSSAGVLRRDDKRRGGGVKQGGERQGGKRSSYSSSSSEDERRKGGRDKHLLPPDERGVDQVRRRSADRMATRRADERGLRGEGGFRGGSREGGPRGEGGSRDGQRWVEGNRSDKRIKRSPVQREAVQGEGARKRNFRNRSTSSSSSSESLKVVSARSGREVVRGRGGVRGAGRREAASSSVSSSSSGSSADTVTRRVRYSGAPMAKRGAAAPDYPRKEAGNPRGDAGKRMGGEENPRKRIPERKLDDRQQQQHGGRDKKLRVKQESSSDSSD